MRLGACALRLPLLRRVRPPARSLFSWCGVGRHARLLASLSRTDANMTRSRARMVGVVPVGHAGSGPAAPQQQA